MAFLTKKPLLMLIVIFVSLQISLYYLFDLSVEQEYRTVRADLGAKAEMLSSNLEERASIVRGIRSFIETVGMDADPSVINAYLASAYTNSKHVMNVMVAPDAIIGYVYPLEGNDTLIGKNLLEDPELASPGMVHETIRSRSITFDGPRTLAQGIQGAVIRQAIYENNRFRGIVSVTLSVQDISEEFPQENSDFLFLGDTNGQHLFGYTPEPGERMLTAPVPVYNQQLVVGIPHKAVNRGSALQQVLWIDFVCLFAIAFIVYTIWNQRRFSRELERLVDVRTHDLRLSERRYEKLAYYDSLTEIPNRRYFMDEFDRLLSKESGRSLALFFFDIDNFKEINDTLGHSVGDQVIRKLARRIDGGGFPCRMFARTGGDEFAMLFQDLPEGQIDGIAVRISELAGQTMQISDVRLNLSTSTGVSLYPQHATTKDDLLKFADIAMYRAKAQDDVHHFVFNGELADSLKQRTLIFRDLKAAFEHNQFVLHYQPQVNAVSGDIVGLEALIRWNHPKQGLLGPGAFIAAVEEAGLMIRLTEWVIQETCRQLSQWRDQGLPIYRTSINVSNSCFYNGSLLDNLLPILERYGLEPHWLEFEITESTALLEKHYPLLTQIRDRGIVVSIDDFGTKFSSLNYLKHFPVNKIKIDRTFISGIGRSSIDETIIKSIIYVASQLNYELIAEGVETEEQAGFLVEQGCPFIQGFLYYRPLAPDHIAALPAG